jgi:hypothetical protein
VSTGTLRVLGGGVYLVGRSDQLCLLALVRLRQSLSTIIRYNASARI